MDNSSTNQTILVIDDAPDNIEILDEILRSEYSVKAALNGEKALKIANSDDPPDLILLDIMMPEMDGYEVCRRLKANKKTQNIPIIFLTAKNEVEDEAQGLELGAVDYITKPIKVPILCARIKTHLELKAAREKLEKQNATLLEAAVLREDVERITRHDVKTPLSVIISVPDILTMTERLTPNLVRNLNMIKESGYKILHILNLSLDLLKMERGIYPLQPQNVDILRVITQIIQELQILADSKGLSVKMLIHGMPANTGDTFPVLGEELLCYTMLTNLIKNALEASPPNEVISIDMENKEKACIHIHNKGCVPREIQDRFFQKYVTSGKKGGTGLGTYSARLMAETQKGSIHLDVSKQGMTTVSVRLPKG